MFALACLSYSGSVIYACSLCLRPAVVYSGTFVSPGPGQFGFLNSFLVPVPNLQNKVLSQIKGKLTSMLDCYFHQHFYQYYILLLLEHMLGQSPMGRTSLRNPSWFLHSCRSPELSVGLERLGRGLRCCTFFKLNKNKL